MIQTSISDFKTNLSDYLRRVENNEVVQVCRHNRPIAEIHRLTGATQSRGKRELGVGRRLFGVGEIPESTFHPLPDDMLGDLGPIGTYLDEQ